MIQAVHHTAAADVIVCVNILCVGYALGGSGGGEGEGGGVPVVLRLNQLAQNGSLLP